MNGNLGNDLKGAAGWSSLNGKFQFHNSSYTDNRSDENEEPYKGIKQMVKVPVKAANDEAWNKFGEDLEDVILVDHKQ